MQCILAEATHGVMIHEVAAQKLLQGKSIACCPHRRQAVT